ncbi:PAS domain-containing protein [Sphingomonas tabacisoli]|uniref:histidine kinase n=1 Tax=Sphingomonas tabacisoli TaxID=2249466 RepID=A0ABW4HZC3_9SPHN
MGARIREFDWSATAMGSPELWPQSLRSALSICLHSSFPTCIYWGPELRLLYNDAWSPIPAERHPWALGQPAEAVWTDIWQVVGPQFMRVFTTGEGFSTFDQMLPMERGGIVRETYWNYSLTPIRGEDGVVVGVFNQGHETTDRVLAERRSVEERERLGRMFDQAPGFMAMLRGPDHVFELANAAYLRLIGQRDVIGRRVRDALPEVDGQGYFETLDNVYATGEAFAGTALPVELRRTPDGPTERRFVDLIYQPITDVAGRISGIFVQGTDVTERVAAESGLRESEARFRELIEHAPDKMWVNEPNGSVAYFNAAWREYTGHPVTPEGLSWTEAFHPQDRALLLKQRTQAIAAGVPYIVEARMRRVIDGSWRWHVCRVAPIRRDGAIFAWAGMAADIDDVRSAQHALANLNKTLETRVAERTAELEAAHEQLRHAQKMEAIGQLTGGLAHDLNNMLTVVTGNLDMARIHLAGEDEARVQRAIANATRGAESAGSLTRRLLAFARRQPLNPQTLDTANLVGGMTDLLMRALGETVQLRVTSRRPSSPIHVDAHQLENAIVNLAVNARDAMPAGGELEITIDEVALGSPEAKQLDLPSGDYIEIAIADTGSGMSEDVLARVFEPFFTTKEQGKGTGLGLSMVYGFTKQSGGSVSVDSRLGAGTTVRLLFPRVSEPTLRIAPADLTADAHGGSESVLLVEDQDDVAELATSILREAGYRVERVATGEEALGRLRDFADLDLIFTDVVMPGGVSGIALAKAARERLPKAKVLLTSGYSTEPLELAGDFSFLSKPYRRPDLLAKVRAVLDGG